MSLMDFVVIYFHLFLLFLVISCHFRTCDVLISREKNKRLLMLEIENITLKEKLQQKSSEIKRSHDLLSYYKRKEQKNQEIAKQRSDKADKRTVK